MVMRPWLVLETGLELTCLIDKQLARLSTPREHRRQPGATREGRGRAHRQPPPTIKVRKFPTTASPRVLFLVRGCIVTAL